MAYAKVEALFFEDFDPSDYPSLLLLTSEPDAVHRSDTLDRLEWWDTGEAVPHGVNFQNPSDLLSLLTDRRGGLLRSNMAERADNHTPNDRAA